MPRFIALVVLAACTPEPTPVVLPTPQVSTEDLPATFGTFYGELQDQLCPLAEGECADASDLLDCDDRTSVPSCEDYDPVLGWACLDAQFTCTERGIVSDSRACEVVCSDGSFNAFGKLAPPDCVQMLLCDQAFADALDVQTSFNGLDDVNYGDGGTCYEGDPDACAAACRSAVDGFRTGLEAAVSAGTIASVPSECL